MPMTARGGTYVLPILALGLALMTLAPPASAQLFDFDNMVLLGRHDLYSGYNDVWGFVGTDGHEYIIQGTTTGTAWWDVEDPANAVHVAFIPGAFSTWRDMFVIGNYAYVGTEGGGGIQIVDISDPTNPTLVATYTDTVGASHNIFGDPSRNLLFVVGGSGVGGLQVLDVTVPTAPVEIGSWQNQYIHDMSIEGDLAYVSLISANRFRILDLTDPANPLNFGKTFTDGSSHACWPIGDGIHVALTQETSGGHVKIVTIAEPDTIKLVDEDAPAPGESAHNVHVQGDRMFISWYVRGTRVYDVADPTNIQEVGYFDTFPDAGGGLFDGNWGVYPHLPSGLIAANDQTYGLFLLRYDPDAATLDGTISSSGAGLLEGATVRLLGTGQALETDATGAYKFSADAGSWDIEVSAYAHVTDTTTVAVAAGGTTTTNILLTKLPAGGLAGVVTNQLTELPIEGAQIAVPGTPLFAVTDASGEYSFPEIPTSPSPNYLVNVTAGGYGQPGAIPVQLTTGDVTTLDIELPPAAVYVDFSDPSGWSIVNDPATTAGFWEFGEPAGTYSNGIPFQPELDNSVDPEDQAAITGNSGGSLGGNDVDGGATRLFSPTYDLSSMIEPHVTFYRWYAVNDVQDAWQVHVTTNGGGSWALLESTTSHEVFWKGIDVDLSPVTGPAAAVQFRFTAEDPDPGQLVEAALDDFAIYDASFVGATGVTLPEKHVGLELSQNFPNPFPAKTRIRFALPREDHVRLSVFDVTGRRVATLVDAQVDAGVHEADWDGRSFGGERVAAGVYFYELKTRNEIQTRKMTRIR
jgi:choice-of-anchor B domain-containing protein